MPEHDDGHERRTSQRFDARFPIRLDTIDDLASAYSSDVSRGGMYVASSSPLPLDTVVDLSIELPDGKPPAIVPARVVYVVGEADARARGKAPGMGLQFVDRDAPELMQRISECLATALEADAPREAASYRVLVVEDSPTYRSEIVRALRDAGHRVSVAEDGLSGLGKAIKELPDVVLSDVTMPTMDGWQMLRMLRARAATRRIPVVFLTTLGSDRDRLRGYEAGIDDYVAKPFDRADLLARVERTVARSLARSESPKDAGVTAMTGDLRLVPLPSVLAFAEAERRSGVLVVRSAAGEARVGLAEGLVVRVDLPDRDAPPSLFERLLRLLDTTVGRFELSAVPVPPSAEVASVQQALLEHARRRDETSR